MMSRALQGMTPSQLAHHYLTEYDYDILFPTGDARFTFDLTVLSTLQEEEDDRREEERKRQENKQKQQGRGGKPSFTRPRR